MLLALPKEMNLVILTNSDITNIAELCWTAQLDENRFTKEKEEYKQILIKLRQISM